MLRLLLPAESESKAQGSDAFGHLEPLPENEEPILGERRISLPEVDPLERPAAFPSPKGKC